MGEKDLRKRSGVSVATFGGNVHVEWDPAAAVTPMGQLPFFIDFLKTAELFDPWVEECPLEYQSPNAPSKRDVLGTILLSVLAGHRRYAHITSMRCDGVNPGLLGMSKVMSEDSIRRAFKSVSAQDCQTWQRDHLGRCYETVLQESWILDVDTTVKPLYGHQEGAVVGFNPRKPGRPSHVYHTYFVGTLRLVLDVEVQPGNQSSSKHSRGGLFEFLDELPGECRPEFLRGDSGFGNEATMKAAEERELPYLFKLRRTAGVKRLIEKLFTHEAWVDAGQGWEGTESHLRLSGWSAGRRVIVLRRQVKNALMVEGPKQESGQGAFVFIETAEAAQKYEYAVLVTSLTDEVLTIAQYYRDRSDSENAFDELKNQWGWGGFMTRDITRCQVMARHIALIYNWWSLFARLASPHKHTEAVTSRPLLLQAIAKQTRHAGQTTLTITSMHGRAESIRQIFQYLTAFFQHLRSSAEQLTWQERWKIILGRIFIKFLHGRLPGATDTAQINP